MHRCYARRPTPRKLRRDAPTTGARHYPTHRTERRFNPSVPRPPRVATESLDALPPQGVARPPGRSRVTHPTKGQGAGAAPKIPPLGRRGAQLRRRPPSPAETTCHGALCAHPASVEDGSSSKRKERRNARDTPSTLLLQTEGESQRWPAWPCCSNPQQLSSRQLNIRLTSNARAMRTCSEAACPQCLRPNVCMPALPARLLRMNACFSTLR